MRKTAAVSRLRRNGISITEESALLGSQHPVSAHEVKVEIFTRRVERTASRCPFSPSGPGVFMRFAFLLFLSRVRAGVLHGVDGIGQDGKGRLGLSMEIRWRLLYVLVCRVDICGLERESCEESMTVCSA